MNFVKRFVNSVYKFDEYGELVKLSLKSALFYYIIISAVTIAAMCLVIAPVMTEVFNAIEYNTPDFSVKNGELVLDEPFRYQNNGIAVIMDASCDDVSSLTEDVSSQNGIFVGKKSILVKNSFTGSEDTAELSDFEGFSSDDMGLFIKTIKSVSYVILVLCFIMLKVVLLIFSWCLSRLMSNIMKGGLSMKDSLKLGIYAMTLAVVLKTALYFTPIALPNIIFYALILIYIYFGIKCCKTMRAEA